MSTLEHQTIGLCHEFGYVRSKHEGTLLDLCIREGWIKPWEVFLDLGSGDGKVCFAAARLGLISYGIELAPELFAMAEQQRLSLGLDNPKFFLGNYFPREYRLHLPQSLFVFTDERDQDLREQIALSSVDVFYAYLWESQIDPVLGLFAGYAKPSARLIIPNCFIGITGFRKLAERHSLDEITNYRSNSDAIFRRKGQL